MRITSQCTSEFRLRRSHPDPGSSRVNHPVELNFAVSSEQHRAVVQVWYSLEGLSPLKTQGLMVQSKTHNGPRSVRQSPKSGIHNCSWLGNPLCTECLLDFGSLNLIMKFKSLECSPRDKTCLCSGTPLLRDSLRHAATAGPAP